MILEFTTKRNVNGHKKYLAIDTGAEIYTRFSSRIATEGIEIKTSNYKELIEKLKRLEYKEVDMI